MAKFDSKCLNTWYYTFFSLSCTKSLTNVRSDSILTSSLISQTWRLISNDQKPALRDRHNRKPRLWNLQLKQWFEANTASLPLYPESSANFAYLDSDSLSENLNGKRRRAEPWLELEKVLFGWT